MLIAQRPTLTEEVVGEHRSRFVIEPLEPGFGYTLGNPLRRTLLSSIPGASVTSIRIDGVLHEFTTVPGVKEDVTELILNIKQLVVSSEHDEPVVMYLRKQGPGAVPAADIAPPAGVEVHNPDLHLATLNDKGKLEVPKPEKKNGKEDQEQEERTKEGEKSVDVKYVHDLNPVSRITNGTMGEPGKRTFFVQAEQGLTLVSVLAEKQQVSALGHSVREMLERLGEAKESGEAVSKYELALREPVEPVFRIGQLGLGYDQANELIVLVAYELPETENPDEVNAVRFWATPRQMRALAKHAEEIVSSGRPICVLCGRPIDPEGHFCPRRNGHGAKATLTE